VVFAAKRIIWFGISMKVQLGCSLQMFRLGMNHVCVGIALVIGTSRRAGLAGLSQMIPWLVR
jgi:hypothetical protein